MQRSRYRLLADIQKPKTTLDYADNPDKTTAREYLDKVVGYHGIQSFRESEVTPEQAFKIGKATARKMWGDRYQVLVTVHLNTDNVHCHFVVNPVSFKDGTKFQNKIGDHKELRRVSDEICREHGLSVLENSNFYGGHKKDYWRHKMCITALYILIHLRTIDSKALYNGLLHEEHDLQAAAVLQSGYCIVVCL